MQIRPRQSLLDLWRATVAYSYRDGTWTPDGRAEPNSTSDAEQLLCLMYPASQVAAFKLDRPDETARDMREALAQFGGAADIPQKLITALRDYMERYTTGSNTPVFAGGSYLEPRVEGELLIPEQQRLDIVDSFSMSITLSLATLGFLKVFEKVVRRPAVREQISELEKMASRRLTAAMIGLLRSFTVHSFAPDSPAGRALCERVNQRGLPQEKIVAELHEALARVRVGLAEVTVGSGGAEALENEEYLFECGWSWGVVKDAPRVKTGEPLEQPAGVAARRPFLYFTVVALDGILDLFSERTRILDLLTEEQQVFMRYLQIRWDLTQQYWSTLAGFGGERWALEDIPWRTTDGRESDYYSLLVTSVTVEALVQRRAGDLDLARVARVLDELSARGRVTRRALEDDPAVEMHVPGVRLNLFGAEELPSGEIGPDVVWPVSDFATALLKRTIRVASLARGTALRDQLLRLSDEIWAHLHRRRLTSGLAHGLWDDASAAFPQVKSGDQAPSWYLTERVMECLVVVANMINEDPLRNDRLRETAQDLAIEADHLYSQELLRGSTDAAAMRNELDHLGRRLDRARVVAGSKPGSSIAILLEVLGALDKLAAARQSRQGDPE
ncbi:SCO2524 family protein [Frankia gtarii]|uniref:SCO2524 family protein n=1 Tax=Frankia gtarii TaxID=2950102 RepID=UPI0021BF0238|nr:SCO2524 family protein [Frankia gtarii]